MQEDPTWICIFHTEHPMLVPVLPIRSFHPNDRQASFLSVICTVSVLLSPPPIHWAGGGLPSRRMLKYAILL